MKKLSVLIVGCGAIGSNLCTNFIDIKDQIDLTVLDFDSVEGRNFRAGTQYYHPTQLGMLKVKALQFNSYKMLNIHLNTIDTKLSEDNIKLLKDFDLIIDTFDNYDSRKLVYEYCKKNKLPCLHIGFSPQMTFEICWNEHYTPPSDYANNAFDICEASGARSFIMFVAALGSIVIQDYIQNNKKREFLGNRFSISSLQ